MRCRYISVLTAGSGGALYLASNANGTVSNCTFTGSSAAVSKGSGIPLACLSHAPFLCHANVQKRSASMILRGSLINSCGAGGIGGALYASSTGSTGSLVIDTCQFTNSVAKEDAGGAFVQGWALLCRAAFLCCAVPASLP